MNSQKEKCLVSACLTGLSTRYDGCSKPDSRCLRVLQDFDYIPICPEQLGGLPTPRSAAELIGGDGRDVLQGRARVVTVDGIDVTNAFLSGARAVLKIARDQNITLALLKAKSPSCGLTPMVGVTAALLERHGIRVVEY